MEKPINIIIAEDKAKWRKVIRTELAAFKIHTIAEAANGLELLKHLEKFSPDVILLDLAMPVMDGSETMRLLNKKYPALKVIIMSLYDAPALMEDYIKRGAKGYFSKNEAAGSLQELAHAIRKVHKGGKYFNLEDEGFVKLTVRQKEIITLVSDGKTDKEIAAELKITPRGIGKQKKKIMQILGVKKLTELYSVIFELGLRFFRRPAQ